MRVFSRLHSDKKLAGCLAKSSTLLVESLPVILDFRVIPEVR
jgi:hypothetical protein